MNFIAHILNTNDTTNITLVAITYLTDMTSI